MKYLPFVLAPLALGLSTIHAAENPLNEVVVTAERTLSDTRSDLDATTVITREDIERTQPDSLASLLSRVANISVPANGGPLTTTGLFLRGFKSSQILFLIDGVRVNDANQGSIDLSLIRPDDIERIEIVRGGYSSQYGSDAMGGVIQIFTRKQTSTSVHYRVGSYQTHETGVSGGLSNRNSMLRFGLNQLDTRGFNATNANIGFETNNDPDGGRQRTARLGFEHRLSNSEEVSASALLKDGKVEFDDGISEQTFALISSKYQKQISSNLHHQLSLHWQRNQVDTVAFDNRFETIRTGLDWIATATTAKAGNLTAGVNLSDEKALSEPLSSGTLFEKRLDTAGIFLIHTHAVGKWSSRLSARHDHHETYGDFDSGAARLGYQLTDDILLLAGYGTNFRAPTANDLYFPGFCWGVPAMCSFAGNRDLQPEESRQADIGMTWQVVKNHTIRANAYRSLVDNLIAFNSIGSQSININKAQLRGVELELNGQIANTTYQLAASRAQVRSANAAAQLRRPKSQISGNIDQKLHDRLHAGLELSGRNETPDVGGNVDGFSVWNAYASWQATRKLSLGVRLENLLDRRYEVLRGYNTADRSGYVTARYTF